MSGTSFVALLDGLSESDGEFKVTLPEDWLQGRTAYGGLSAALCYEAAVRSTPDLPPLRSAQFAFIGPAIGELTVVPALLRRGKSAAFYGVDLWGEAGVAARALLCFGAERESEQTFMDVDVPEVPAWEESRDFFNRRGTPGFTQHFRGRMARGANPCTPDADPDMWVWLSHEDPESLPDTLTPVLALADALPPAIMIPFSAPAPVSTMTWAIDVLTDSPKSETGRWLLRSVAESAGHGYSAQAMTLWNDKREPIMAMRQTVAIFI